MTAMALPNVKEWLAIVLLIFGFILIFIVVPLCLPRNRNEVEPLFRNNENHNYFPLPPDEER